MNLLIINKENYHYACEKLKKDQERLRKSGFKQRKQTGEDKPLKRKGRNMSKSSGNENPNKHTFLKRKEPSYRPPSISTRKNIARKNTVQDQSKTSNFEEKDEIYRRKPNININHGNAKQNNLDLDEIMSIADQADEQFKKARI